MSDKKQGISPIWGMTGIAAILGLIHIILVIINARDLQNQIMVGKMSVVTFYLFINPYIVWILSIVYYYWTKSWEASARQKIEHETKRGVQA